MLVHMPDGRTLSAYHDGELSAGTAVEIGQHLERCTTCKEEYERLAKVANVVRHLHRSEAPVTLARAIRRRVDEELRGMVLRQLSPQVFFKHLSKLSPYCCLSISQTLGVLAT